MHRQASLSVHVHGEAVRKALQEARPVGLTLKQLCQVTRRSPTQAWTGLQLLRKVAVKEGPPPVTFNRRDGFRLSENSDGWIAYERTIFKTELHRINQSRNFHSATTNGAAIAPRSSSF